VVQIYAATPEEARLSWVRNIPTEDVPRYGEELISFMRAKHPQIMDEIKSSGELSDELKPKLEAALDAFGKVFEPSGTVDVPTAGAK
jgi:F-type H+-transporting ATPase subunit alpha